ncbi:MAG: restriction endonuclease subunit S, partial [Armatimonadota bacterium]|nr:restriction endonuclease subunit S [Armatimonadota bacterium]
MAGEWVEKAIVDIADVAGGSTPSTRDPENFDGDVPWITPKDLAGPHPRYVSRGERNLSRKGLQSCSAQLLPENSVLLSSRAPIGYLAIAANPLATNQGFRSLVVKPDYDHEYVYYWLSANVEQLERHATGSTFKELSGSALKQIRIRLPADRSEQRAIAHILGTLDDKIELNRRMSETLEAMARALFKSWFVDFDPVRAKMEGRWRRGESLPGLPAHLYGLFPARLVDSELGEIPEGWEVGTLGDVCSLNPEVWTKETRPSEIRYVDLSNTKWGRIETVTVYPAAEAPSRAQRVLRPGDTIVGTVRPANGSYALISEPGLTGSTGFAVLRPNKPAYAEVVYLAATSRDNIDTLAHLADGAAYPAVRPEVVAATPIVHPDNDLLERLASASGPLLAKMATNERQSRTLAALRDALLPKLISGEIRVKDAERFLKER